MAPMAMPMSARPSTGASLTPSPTKASFAFAALLRQQRLHLVHLVARQQLAVYLVHAQLRRHRVGHRLCVAGEHDGLFHAGLLAAPAMASLAWGFTTSEMTMCPAYCAVHRHVDDGTHAVAVVVVGMPSCSMSLPLPAATAWPSTTAVTPWPLISSNVRHAAAVDGLAVGAAARLLLMGWEEAHSASAAYSSSFSLVHVAVVHRRDLEHAPGQGAGLVEHHDLRLRTASPDSWSP